MKVIDAHLHLDSWKYPELEDAANALEAEINNAKLEKVIFLHLQIQPWTIENVSQRLNHNPKIVSFINVHPRHQDAENELLFGIQQLGFKGLKLHPRLQEYFPNEACVISLCRLAGELNVPVLLDAFPDGTALMQGFDPLKYAELAKACPNTKFIWAHMGGHKVIDFMMLAKRLPNVYMDCSYSLLYYRGSSVTDDLLYAMKSMRYDRIFYGSDYPDRSLKDSLEQSLVILEQYGVNGEALNKIMYENCESLLNV